MNSIPYQSQNEVIELAKKLEKNLSYILADAGSRGTAGRIENEDVVKWMHTMDSILFRGHEGWHKWWQTNIAKPLSINFNCTEPGLLLNEQLPINATNGEVSARSDVIRTHRDRLSAPYNPILEALGLFVLDFPRGLGPPAESAQASRFGKGGAKTMGLDELLIKYPKVKEGGSGPVAVLRVLLKDHLMLWSQNKLAESDTLKEGIPREKASATSVGRWLKKLASEGLAESSGEKTARRWQAGVNCRK
jgi:hypothetical protein